MKSKTIVEVNGRRYDAVTGTLISTPSAPHVRSTGRNIDGFFRSRTSEPKTLSVTDRVPAAVPATTPMPEPKRQAGRKVNHARAHAPQAARTITVRESNNNPHRIQKIRVHRTPTAANPARRHSAQHSQTLIRTAVHRPKPSFHKRAGTVGTLQHSVPSLIVPKASVSNIDASRLARSRSISRSPRITRHAAAHHAAIMPVVTHLAVQPVPGQPVPVKPEGEVPNTTPAPQPTNKPDDSIFEQALMQAGNFIDMQGHTKRYRRHARQHVASMAAGTLALLVIAGFAAYQNTPGLQFKVASIQAGVSTNMPNFKAAGFAYDGAHAHSGTLTVGFSSTNAHYQLTQTATNLSNRDMIQTVGGTDAGGNPNYKTINAGGTSVYRFDNTNATWVSNGTWYTVSGNGPLSDQQVESLVHNI